MPKSGCPEKRGLWEKWDHIAARASVLPENCLGNCASPASNHLSLPESCKKSLILCPSPTLLQFLKPLLCLLELKTHHQENLLCPHPFIQVFLLFSCFHRNLAVLRTPLSQVVAVFSLPWPQYYWVCRSVNCSLCSSLPHSESQVIRYFPPAFLSLVISDPWALLPRFCKI